MGTYCPEYQHQPSQPYRLNSFRLEGLERVNAGYRLIQVDGLIDDDDFEKKIRQLSNLISGSVKMPTEPIRIDGETRLAVVGQYEELKALRIADSYSLMPEVVSTSLEERVHQLSFKCNNNRIQTKLARKALDWAIDKALKCPEAGWWKYDRRFISREAVEHKSTPAIEVLLAFYFGFTPGVDGALELSINPSVCNVERKSAYQKYGCNIPASVKGRRFLYRNGTDFYEIDAVGIGKSAEQDLMIDPDTGQPISIQQRLKHRWKGKGLPLIEQLDGRALTIAYKTKSQLSRKAHSQLLFELVGVNGTDEGYVTPHGVSIMSPDVRGQLTEKIIGQLAQRLTLFGVKLKPRLQMRKLNGEVQIFAPPKLRFADGQELSTNLSTMGRDRFEALKHLGPADSSDFADEQMFIYGESFPLDVRRDFKERFCANVKEIYGKAPRFTNVPVADRQCGLMRQHFNAFESAIGNKRGYGLLILPKERKDGQTKKLHDHLKRTFWEKVQTQCASVESILGFYTVKKGRFGEESWTVNSNKLRDYRSYLRFLALGYLEVNRKWLWKLAEGTLQNDVHVGIDVYQNLAVFTFVYGDADLITFHLSRAKRGEKLSTSQVREALIENLGKDLKQLGLCPSSIVFHRDGRVFDSEIKGIKQALQELKPLVAETFRYGIVEIHKTSANRPRLYKWQESKFNNPDMGLLAELNAFEGVLATTGAPLLQRGTAQPLAIELIEGDIKLADLAQDIYCLSHLSFASPGSAMSLPFTIALADGILRESSPGKEINLWDEEDETAPQASFSHARSMTTRVGVAVR